MIRQIALPPGVAALAEVNGWRVEAISGSAGDLHAAGVTAERLVRVNLVERPAVVLGSAQKESTLGDSLPRGVDVARRRSGGGAVWLSPGDQVWVDIVLPVGDPLWVDDVGRSSLWLGRCWATLGPSGTSVSEGPMLGRSAGAVACFAGSAPGEVMVGESKLVGISQRRTSSSARFQCVVYLRWDPEPLLEALGSGDAEVEHGLRKRVAHLAAEASAVSAGWSVVEQLLAVLP